MYNSLLPPILSSPHSNKGTFTRLGLPVCTTSLRGAKLPSPPPPPPPPTTSFFSLSSLSSLVFLNSVLLNDAASAGLLAYFVLCSVEC